MKRVVSLLQKIALSKTPFREKVIKYFPKGNGGGSTVTLPETLNVQALDQSYRQDLHTLGFKGVAQHDKFKIELKSNTLDFIVENIVINIFTVEGEDKAYVSISSGPKVTMSERPEFTQWLGVKLDCHNYSTHEDAKKDLAAEKLKKEYSHWLGNSGKVILKIAQDFNQSEEKIKMLEAGIRSAKKRNTK